MGILKGLWQKLLALLCVFLLLGVLFYEFWGKYLYLVTAYCNCPICVNVKEFQDDQFANGKKIYWGGIAADPRVKFGSKVELVPVFPRDFFKINTILRGKRDFVVEDRGGLIKGRHIDLFIPDSFGGHKTAKKWGRVWMRVKINGSFAE